MVNKGLTLQASLLELLFLSSEVLDQELVAEVCGLKGGNFAFPHYYINFEVGI